MHKLHGCHLSTSFSISLSTLLSLSFPRRYALCFVVFYFDSFLCRNRRCIINLYSESR